MQVLKSIVIAFSLYSHIPVPRYQWNEEDMKYVFCFFPWIGAVIGGCVYFWNRLCDLGGAGILCRTTVTVVLPVFITGGLHVDGFMDTMDALHSYQPRERKLEILKDSHIGAFAAIMFAVYGLVYLGAFSEIQDDGILKSVCGGFFLSRCLSGIGAVSFPLAKKDGMLYLFADRAHKGIVKGTLYLESAVCVGFMILASLEAGIFVAASAFVALAYYYRMCRREFGGITGDTAGYFLVVCEISMAVTAAAINVMR